MYQYCRFPFRITSGNYKLHEVFLKIFIILKSFPMNYLLQRADNINENERKNDLVKPWVDQVLEGGGALCASARGPADFWSLAVF